MDLQPEEGAVQEPCSPGECGARHTRCFGVLEGIDDDDSFHEDMMPVLEECTAKKYGFQEAAMRSLCEPDQTHMHELA
jgi:hypothetical protein